WLLANWSFLLLLQTMLIETLRQRVASLLRAPQIECRVRDRYAAKRRLFARSVWYATCSPFCERPLSFQERAQRCLKQKAIPDHRFQSNKPGCRLALKRTCRRVPNTKRRHTAQRENCRT